MLLLQPMKNVSPSFFRVRYEFNRPFLEAKDLQANDGLAVEATSYALLNIFLVEGGGITFTQDKVKMGRNFI